MANGTNRGLPRVSDAVLAATLIGIQLGVSAAVAAGDRGAGEVTPARSTLELRISPAIDLHMLTRVLANAKDRDVPTGQRLAVDAARKLNDSIGSRSMSWWPLDARLDGCAKVADLRAAWKGVSESFAVGRGESKKSVPLRKMSAALADRYAGFESEFTDSLWPERKARLERILGDMRSGFVPHLPQCLGYMFESLGMKDSELSIPVYLVVEAPWPGAFTLRQPNDVGICFVSVSRPELRDTQLWEIVLHESTHAFDVNPDDHDVFDEMRKRLEKAGVSKREPLFRTVPHTVMFVQAGETIRRFVDKKHIHYGDVSDYYKRCGEACVVVKRTWIDHLDGKITRDDAIDALVTWTVERVGSKP